MTVYKIKMIVPVEVEYEILANQISEVSDIIFKNKTDNILSINYLKTIINPKKSIKFLMNKIKI